jgi:SpoVK/Ycf46/Vps4 family AAA+-type ATPase
VGNIVAPFNPANLIATGSSEARKKGNDVNTARPKAIRAARRSPSRMDNQPNAPKPKNRMRPRIVNIMSVAEFIIHS